MVRKVNKGVSLVEILIAIAVFMVMMIPILSALISGMKMTTTAKETQYRNDFAQNLMESVKKVPLAVLNGGAGTTYFENMGSENVSITTNTDGYEITGKTYLGTNRAEYVYKIKMSDTNYVGSTGIMNPTNQTSGHAQDLEQVEDAMIGSASLANYDTMAYEALRREKISVQRRELGTVNEAVFNSDTGKRIVNIAVTDSISGGYDVTCTLIYSDNCSTIIPSSGKTIGEIVGEMRYIPYKKHFDKLPNIYLMYNVCVYNGGYADDYITFDLSGMTNDEEVKVFVIATAAKYSEDIKNADSENSGNWLKRGPADTLYKTAENTTGTVERNHITVGMAASSGTSDAKRAKLYVYHNMPTGPEWTVDSSSVAASKAGFGCRELVNVGTLDESQEEKRNLYEVKIWMQKGDAIDEGINPVLFGTKGGGEID